MRVYQWYNLLRQMFFIPSDNWNTFFCTNLLLPSSLVHPPCCFKMSVLKKVQILCLLSPQKYYNAANTKGPKQSFQFLNVFFNIYLLIACFTEAICKWATFFFTNGIFKTERFKSSIKTWYFIKSCTQLSMISNQNKNIDYLTP